MNKWVSKYLFYYPVTLAKGEFVALYLPEYRRNQYLSASELEALQRTRLRNLFGHAARYSDFYKERLDSAVRSLKQNAPIAEVMETIPYLTKQDLIDHRDSLVAYPKHWSSSKTTGGSTGEPVRLLKNPNALARERAATWRAYEWAGVTIGDKQARFWGVPHATSDRLKAKLIDAIANRQRISAFDLSPKTIDAYYRLLQRYRPAYLYGYVSVIEMLADFISEKQLPVLSGLRCVITTSEVLSDAARIKIESAFGVKVFNEYGCGEVGSIAHQCEHGGMHIMADNLYLELHGKTVDEGEIVVTDFFNYAMPLIRYRLGDYASFDRNACSCGRTLPLLKGIHGRAYDIIKLRDGRKLHPESVMYIFEDIQKQVKAFKHFQAIQTSCEQFVVNVVPSSGWSTEVEAQIINRLKSSISPEINATFRVVDDIPREKSGKMRVVKSEVD